MMKDLLANIVNKKDGENQSLYTGIVSSVNPLEVKFYPGDDAISVIATNGLPGLIVGSNVLMVKYLNKFIITNVIGNDSLHKCILDNTSTQSIPTATETSVEFGSGTEEYDPLNMHDTTTNNDRITILKDGIYSCTAGCSFAANSTGLRITYIKINSEDNTQACLRYPVDSGGHWRGTLSRTLVLSKDDYVMFRVYQSSGGNLNIGGTNVYKSFFSVVKI